MPPLTEKEIIEKKIVNAKENGELHYNLSAEESKNIYLKKMDAANRGADHHLNDMEICDDDGGVVASGGSRGYKVDGVPEDGQWHRTDEYGPVDDDAVDFGVRAEVRHQIGASGPVERESWGRWAVRHIVNPLADVDDAVGRLYDYVTGRE